MDESVQVEQDVRVQVVDNINGEYSSCFFIFLHVGEVVASEGSVDVGALLVVVVLLQLVHILFNLDLFLLDHVVNYWLHPGEVGVHITTLLALHVLCSLQEIVLLVEF